MHDLDRIRLEMDSDQEDAFGDGEAGEDVAPLSFLHDGLASEAGSDELEMASRLLDVSDEAELDAFIGDLVRSATGAAGKFVKSPTGRALGRILKGAAKKALPVIGRGIGGMVSPKAARGGATIATGIGQLFGLELEGLSPEDQEFEVARAYVRFARSASRMAARKPGGPPAVTARRAAVVAARRHAPGLLPVLGPASTNGHEPSQGRWVRRGRALVLLDV